mmetsp:Transcript_49011/g.116636  ORF Transcript_49011/g.116636 Transcript_49011/m.116636 type:complete len:272 (-) Transcript_49011:298-1113(-)
MLFREVCGRELQIRQLPRPVRPSLLGRICNDQRLAIWQPRLGAHRMVLLAYGCNVLGVRSGDHGLAARQRGCSRAMGGICFGRFGHIHRQAGAVGQGPSFLAADQVRLGHVHEAGAIRHRSIVLTRTCFGSFRHQVGTVGRRPACLHRASSRCVCEQAGAVGRGAPRLDLTGVHDQAGAVGQSSRRPTWRSIQGKAGVWIFACGHGHTRELASPGCLALLGWICNHDGRSWLITRTMLLGDVALVLVPRSCHHLRVPRYHHGAAGRRRDPG